MYRNGNFEADCFCIMKKTIFWDITWHELSQFCYDWLFSPLDHAPTSLCFSYFRKGYKMYTLARVFLYILHSFHTHLFICICTDSTLYAYACSGGWMIHCTYMYHHSPSKRNSPVTVEFQLKSQDIHYIYYFPYYYAYIISPVCVSSFVFQMCVVDLINVLIRRWMKWKAV